MEPDLLKVAKRELGKAGLSYIGYDVLRQMGYYYSKQLPDDEKLAKRIYKRFWAGAAEPLKTIDEFKDWESKTYNFKGVHPNAVIHVISKRIGWACSRYYYAARQAATASNRKFVFGGVAKNARSRRKQLMSMSKLNKDVKVSIANNRVRCNLTMRYADLAYADAPPYNLNNGIKQSLTKYVKHLTKKLEKTEL